MGKIPIDSRTLEAFRPVYKLRWGGDFPVTGLLGDDNFREAYGSLALMELMVANPGHQIDGRPGPHYTNGQLFGDAAYRFVKAVAEWDKAHPTDRAA
ncbi:MAG: hypothetical protein QT00_C0001G0045 [archaeon GW2011_AR5]|nr:MAG: hypothetical protein QT00_C0001G0045 [archaeon GW2011_AR5]